MKRLYLYDRNGDITGTGSLANPPKTNRRWFISEESPEYFKDKRVVDGAVVQKPSNELVQMAEEELSEKKLEMKRLVAEKIRLARTRFITDLPGQEAIYARKKETAVAYLQSDPLPSTLDDYPLLKKEVGVTAPTAFELAQIWLNLDSLWETVAANLEAVRLGTNQEIDATTTTSELSGTEEKLYADIRNAITTG